MNDLPHGQLLELELLRTFETVVHLGGFTAAAERLHKTQSTVSAQIRRLETLTATRLLERNNQGIQLTSPGEALLGHARRLLSLNAEAMAAVGAHEMSGRVRLGMPADYTATFLSGVLPAFGRAFPRVEVEVHCDLSERLRSQLHKGDLDLVIGTFGINVPGGEVIRAEPLIWAGATGGRAWSLDPVPLAVFPPTCQFREIALRKIVSAGRRARVAYTSPSMAGIEVAIASDFAIAPVTRANLRGTMQELGETENLPALPVIDVSLHAGAGLGEPAERLAQFIRECASVSA